MDIKTELSDGDSRSLGKANLVLEYVLNNKSKIGELFENLFSDDEIVRMRAGDILEKICRQHPEWLSPFIDRLLNEAALIIQPSVQWHIAQMIGELKLSPGQLKIAIKILKKNLESANDWIVLNYSLEVFAQLVRKDDSLRPYFIKQLKIHECNQHKSVAKRATKLLAEF